MRVIADTTPLNYLLLIDHIDILASLYSQVVMPQAVGAELRDPRAPAIVRAWMTALPPWCVIRPVHGRPDPTLMWLDAGEREALMLMQELGADVLLTDDLDGRREALRRGMQVTAPWAFWNVPPSGHCSTCPRRSPVYKRPRFIRLPRLLPPCWPAMRTGNPGSAPDVFPAASLLNIPAVFLRPSSQPGTFCASAPPRFGLRGDNFPEKDA